MTVELSGSALGLTEPVVKAILKLYDRRFAAQLREDEGISPWTEEIEQAFLGLIKSGKAAEFIRRLREEDDFEEPDEGWSLAENEAYLQNMCSDLCSAETRAYEILKTLQGKQIPQFYSVVAVPLDLGPPTMRADVQMRNILTINGILIEYVSGPTVSAMVDVVPRQSWQLIIDQAVQIVRSYSRLGILNKDVRCSNFVVDDAVPDGDEHRVVMLDFALCEFKTTGQSEADWGPAKWSQDEEGAIGAVMRTRLAKVGFELNYAPSHEWIQYAEREEDVWQPRFPF